MPKELFRTTFPLKDFLIFTLGTFALLAVILGFLTLLQTSAAFSINNLTMDKLSPNLSDFQRSNETCSTWVGIAPDEGSENNTNIPCLEKVLEKCQPFDVTLGYVLGSMRISIKGLISEGGDCTLSLLYEIERGQTSLTCTIPLTKMSTWTNWKKGDGLDAVDQIRNYCVLD